MSKFERPIVAHRLADWMELHRGGAPSSSGSQVTKIPAQSWSGTNVSPAFSYAVNGGVRSRSTTSRPLHTVW